MASTITAYLLVFLYLITDARLRSSKKAGSLAITATDRQSTLRLVQAFGVSMALLLLAPLFNYFHFGGAVAGWFPGWFGVLLMFWESPCAPGQPASSAAFTRAPC